MKKIFMLVMVALMTLGVSQKAQAIEDPNPKGTVVLGAQVGFLPGIGCSVFGDYVLVDSWWKGHFTVGGEFLYGHYGRRITGYDYKWIYNDFGFAARATYGLNIISGLEVHAGILTGVGLSTWGWRYNGSHEKHSQVGFCYGGLAGVRYFFTKEFGATAEFQYTSYGTYTNVGVVFKF